MRFALGSKNRWQVTSEQEINETKPWAPWKRRGLWVESEVFPVRLVGAVADGRRRRSNGGRGTWHRHLLRLQLLVGVLQLLLVFGAEKEGP